MILTQLYKSVGSGPDETVEERRLKRASPGAIGAIMLAASLVLFVPAAYSAADAVAQDEPAMTAEERIKSRPGRLRLSFEQLDMPAAGEQMGLFGLGYLIDLSPSLYGGLATYGAITGERGGFFVGGFTGGFRQKLTSKLSAEAGLFVGGGGGGAAPQGGGLMLRPHVGLGYELGPYNVGLFYSLVKFPNGRIDSKQLGLSLEIPLTFRYTDNRLVGQTLPAGRASKKAGPAGMATQSFALRTSTYTPASGTRDTMGQSATQKMDLVGVEFRRFVSDNIFWTADAGGAARGNADGYAEVFLGAGYHAPLAKLQGLALNASAAVGAAGGGGVNTGGGTMARAGIGLEYQLYRDLSLSANMGYVGAMEGGFSARSLVFKVAYVTDSGTYGGPKPLVYSDPVRINGWRWRASHQTYLSAARKAAAGPSEPIQLLGAKADMMLTDHFYFTGQALGAYSGNAGGYAVGLIGPGWESAPYGRARFSAELLIGAGGGGGIAVGGGAIVQPMAGMTYDVTENLSAQLMGGRVKALEGDLNSGIVDFALVYRFGIPGRRVGQW